MLSITGTIDRCSRSHDRFGDRKEPVGQRAVNVGVLFRITLAVATVLRFAYVPSGLSTGYFLGYHLEVARPPSGLNVTPTAGDSVCASLPLPAKKRSARAGVR
jgi:hypothetical protein